MSKRNLITALSIIIIVVLVSAFFFTSPYENYLSNLSFFDNLFGKVTITINTPRSVADIYIDDQKIGQSPLEDYELDSGKYSVQLARATNSETNFYEPVEIQLDLVENTEAFIQLEIGPYGKSYGYILYYEEAPAKQDDAGFLTIRSNANDSSVIIPGRSATSLPLNAQLLDTGEYEINIVTPGHEDIAIPVIVRRNFNLMVEVRPYPIPINNIETAQNE